MTRLGGAMFALSPKRVIDGIPVAVMLFGEPTERETAFARRAAALAIA